MKTNNGFSLIELLIVVVIIGIIAAIAIPGLLSSRRSANEGATISSIRIVHGAQMTYATSYGLGNFAGDIGTGTLTGLGILSSLKLIDDVVGSGSKSGYNYVGGREPDTVLAPAQFFFSAIPFSPDVIVGTGSRRFGIATEGVIKADTTLTVHYADAAETSAAPALGN